MVVTCIALFGFSVFNMMFHVLVFSPSIVYAMSCCLSPLSTIYQLDPLVLLFPRHFKYLAFKHLDFGRT
jgi:hypothetical protein